MKRKTRTSVAQRPSSSSEGLAGLLVSKTRNGQWTRVVCILQVTLIGLSTVSVEWQTGGKEPEVGMVAYSFKNFIQGPGGTELRVHTALMRDQNLA